MGRWATRCKKAENEHPGHANRRKWAGEGDAAGGSLPAVPTQRLQQPAFDDAFGRIEPQHTCSHLANGR
jgi:hypothetical protein